AARRADRHGVLPGPQRRVAVPDRALAWRLARLGRRADRRPRGGAAPAGDRLRRRERAVRRRRQLLPVQRHVPLVLRRGHVDGDPVRLSRGRLQLRARVVVARARAPDGRERVDGGARVDGDDGRFHASAMLPLTPYIPSTWIEYGTPAVAVNVTRLVFPNTGGASCALSFVATSVRRSTRVPV